MDYGEILDERIREASTPDDGLRNALATVRDMILANRPYPANRLWLNTAVDVIDHALAGRTLSARIQQHEPSPTENKPAA